MYTFHQVKFCYFCYILQHGSIKEDNFVKKGINQYNKYLFCKYLSRGKRFLVHRS